MTITKKRSCLLTGVPRNFLSLLIHLCNFVLHHINHTVLRTRCDIEINNVFFLIHERSRHGNYRKTVC